MKKNLLAVILVATFFVTPVDARRMISSPEIQVQLADVVIKAKYLTHKSFKVENPALEENDKKQYTLFEFKVTRIFKESERGSVPSVVYVIGTTDWDPHHMTKSDQFNKEEEYILPLQKTVVLYLFSFFEDYYDKRMAPTEELAEQITQSN